MSVLTAGAVRLCRDPNIKGPDESGASDHGYWIYDAHPQFASADGRGRWACVPDANANGGATQGIDIRTYPSPAAALVAAQDFTRRGGGIVKKQNVWLWGSLGIYEIDPKGSPTAGRVSRVVSQLPGIVSVQQAGS